MASLGLRRSGGVFVELTLPLRYGRATINEIEIYPPNADQILRWGNNQIPSSMALLAELCNIPEIVLRQLGATDFERVLTGFSVVLPPILRQDYNAGSKPIATPGIENQQYEEGEYVPPEEPYQPPPEPMYEQRPPSPPSPATTDRGPDWPFPSVEGPIKRLDKAVVDKLMDAHNRDSSKGKAIPDIGMPGLEPPGELKAVG